MKTLFFREVTTVLLLTMTSPLLAGGVAGGGGPPARQELEEMLQGGPMSAAVFAWDQNQLGLGVDAELQPQMLVTRTADQPQALQISNDDFERVAERTQLIQAVNLDGEVRSYHVAKTLAPDTLILVAPL